MKIGRKYSFLRNPSGFQERPPLLSPPSGLALPSSARSSWHTRAPLNSPTTLLNPSLSPTHTSGLATYQLMRWRRASLLACCCPCLLTKRKPSCAAGSSLNRRERDSLLSMYGLEELSEVSCQGITSSIPSISSHDVIPRYSHTFVASDNILVKAHRTLVGDHHVLVGADDILVGSDPIIVHVLMSTVVSCHHRLSHLMAAIWHLIPCFVSCTCSFTSPRYHLMLLCLVM